MKRIGLSINYLCCALLGILFFNNVEAQNAATTTSLLSTINFGVLDVNDGSNTFDGVGDEILPAGLPVVLKGTEGEAAQFAEFNIGSLSQTPNISSVIFQATISSFQVSGLGVNVTNPGSIGIFGYVGNGTAETSDFAAGVLLSSLDVSGLSPGALLNFDVTQFVKQLVSNKSPFTGFGIRALNLGGLSLKGSDIPGSQPKLIITVTDNTAPNITACAPAQTRNANANCQAVVPDFTGNVIATDNSTAAGSLVITQSPIAGTLVGTGVTEVTITVRDAAGNPTTCTTTFTVIDNTAPTIKCPSNITLSACQSTATWTVPTASDNCGIATVARIAGPASGSTFANGSTTTVTYEATDASNNKTKCSFTVTRAPALVATCGNTNPVLYFGYTGNQSSTISGTSTGGTGAVYSYHHNESSLNM